jgi:hypothetical protein
MANNVSVVIRSMRLVGAVSAVVLGGSGALAGPIARRAPRLRTLGRIG